MLENGWLLGYDPGGNGSHGLALARIEEGQLSEVSVQTVDTAESVVSIALGLEGLVAVGVDTLTCWSTGPSGWRPADSWLKQQYPEITNSIASANSLFGAMGLNGMSVLMSLRGQIPGLLVTETHPKVLYRALTGEKYDYKNTAEEMDRFLNERLGISVKISNDHEWDAAISLLAIREGFMGNWNHDLHGLESSKAERLISPCGPTKYWWPKI